MSLDLESIEKLESRPFDLPQICPVFKSLSERSEALSARPFLPRGTIDWRHEPRWSRTIKGRKWQQIKAFAETLKGASEGFVGAKALVDWCGGKGHLGRSLGLAGLCDGPVTVLEKQAELCQDAEMLGQKAGQAVAAWPVDVLESASAERLRGCPAVALHACGQLSRALIVQGLAQASPALAVVGCCYHRIQGHAWQPLSRLGRECLPSIHRGHLRLATLEPVASSAKDLARRRHWLAYRVGMSLLVAEVAPERAWRLGYFPPSWVKQPFAEFCQRLAEAQGLPLPARFDPEEVLGRAERKARELRALSLLRLLFRRCLELALVLDRALFMQERGMNVKVGRFCTRDITPRNLMILGSTA